MKVSPLVTPSGAPALPTAQAEVQVSARDRAINAFMQGSAQQAQQHPVANPTQVSPEEMSQVMGNSGQNNIVEEEQAIEAAAPAPEALEEEKPSPLSQQYAILARKEKAIRMREAQIRAKEAAMRQSESASKPSEPSPAPTDLSRYVDKESLTRDPFRVLQELGLSYDQLTELALNSPKPSDIAFQNEIKNLRDELKALKGETENTKKSFQESQEQQYQTALNQITAEARSLVSRDPSFEAIKASGAVKDVVELIDRTYKEDGILMTVEDAAIEVENQLVEEAMRLARINKVQQRLTTQRTSAQKPSSQLKQLTSQPQEQQQAKTLTNSISSSKKLSSRERAIAVFEGRIKN